MRILEELGKRLIFFDGGMGTMLQQKGLAAGELPELWNLTHPELITEIQTQYCAAGADIVKTNTFGANEIKLSGCGHSVEEIITAGVQIAKKATAGTNALVAMDIGPTGKLMKPLGDLAFEKAYAVFSQAAAAGEKAGADLILIETMVVSWGNKISRESGSSPSNPIMAISSGVVKLCSYMLELFRKTSFYFGEPF